MKRQTAGLKPASSVQSEKGVNRKKAGKGVRGEKGSALEAIIYGS